MGTTPSTTVAPAEAASAKRAQKSQEVTPCDHAVISDSDTNTKEAEAFQLTGWTGQNERFNGDYLPAGSETYNDRPIFIHKNVVGPRAGEDFWMYWTAPPGLGCPLGASVVCFGAECQVCMQRQLGIDV